MTEVQLVYSFLLGALILMKIPYLGKALRVVNTMVHETGHALVVVATSGKVVKVELFANLSGTTHAQSSSKLALVATSVAGYVFASFMAWLSVFMVFNGFYKWVMVIMLTFAVVNLVFYVRNGYGMLWLAVFIVGCGLVLSKGGLLAEKILATVIMSLLLVDSVLSTIELLLISFREPKKAGDAALLQKTTGVPAQLFALLFVGLAVLAAYNAVSAFFPPLSLLFK